MDRREALLGTASALSGVLAGCAGIGTASEPPVRECATLESEDAPSTESQPSVPCPGASASAPVACTQTADGPEIGAVTVVRSDGALPEVTKTLRLRNDSDRRFTTRSDDWAFAKWADGQWRDVPVETSTGTETTIRPGESAPWTLAVNNRVIDPTVPSDAQRAMAVSGLGPGTYAFTIAGRLGGGEGHHSTVRYSTQLFLACYPMRVGLSDGVAVRERTETTVTLTDADRQGPTTYTLARANDATDARTVTVEQLFQAPHVRHLFAVATGCGYPTVRLVDVARLGERFRRLFLEAPLSFQGHTYELTGQASD